MATEHIRWNAFSMVGVGPRNADPRIRSIIIDNSVSTAMTAFDGDLEFEARDLARVRASYPGGPQGVFLKRVRDRSGERNRHCDTGDGLECHRLRP